MTTTRPLDREWLDNRWRLILIAVLSASLAAAPVFLFHRLLPAVRLGWLPPFLLLAALEGAWTTHWLGYPEKRRKSTLALRLGELVLLLTLLRVLTWVFILGWPTWEIVYAWLLSPLLFFDFVFSTFAVLLLVAWGEAVTLTGLFGRMALQPDELQAAQRGRWDERPLPFADRSALATAVADHWLAGAFWLVLVAGFSRLTIRAGETIHLGLRTVALPREFLLLLLVYFLGGLFLVGEARRGALRAQWHFEGTRWQKHLPSRWRHIALAILVIAALVASLIPFGSADPLAPLAESLFLLLLQIAYVLASLVFLLFMFLVSLLPFSATPTPSAPPPQEIVPRAQQAARHLLPPWFGGAIVWVIVIALLALLLRAYWRERGLTLSWSALKRWWAALLLWWKREPPRARRLVKRVLGRARQRGVRLPRPHLGGPSLPFSLIPWRRLDPNQQVRYYYLSALRHAQRAGYHRRENQTPHEFQDTLAAQRPDLTDTLRLLTIAFERARYADHPFDKQEAEAIRRAWEHFRQQVKNRPPPFEAR